MIRRVFSVINSSVYREKSERFILAIAIAVYLIRLFAIFVTRNYPSLNLPIEYAGGDSYLSAIYWPFAIVLLYEVYLSFLSLVDSPINFHLRQFQIVSLIIMGTVFKDLSKLESNLTVHWSSSHLDEVIVGLLGSLILYGLVRYCRQCVVSRYEDMQSPEKVAKLKQLLAVLLYVISIGYLLYGVYGLVTGSHAILFDTFYRTIFTLLIVVDILMLLVTLVYIEEYAIVLRQFAFIAATILVRYSLTQSIYFQVGLAIFGIMFTWLFLELERRVKSLPK